VSDDEIGPDAQTTLVGRARELEAIATAMMTARRRTARVVQLVGGGRYRQDGTGRAGSGAGRRAGLGGGVGPSVGVEAAAPYWIWQQVLGSLARTTNVALRLLALVPAFRRGFAEQLSAIGPGEADR
jgi:hypothetical protein